MACPEAEGATELSPGFQPWEPSNKRFALLKGREIRVPDEARTYCRAKIRVRNWDLRQLTIGLRFRLVRTFDLAPLQHLQPGGPGVFPTRRYEVTPYEGASLVVDDSRVETLG